VSNPWCPINRDRHCLKGRGLKNVSTFSYLGWTGKGTVRAFFTRVQTVILSTHAVVGAALATLLPSEPALIALAGIASHFAIDAIPHWDYPLRGISVSKDVGKPLRLSRALARDCVLIALDACLGLALAAFLFGPSWTVGLGAIAAMLPDPLQFLHRLYPREPLRTLQRFHGWIHSDWKLRWPVGIASQLAFVAAVVAAVNLHLA
jgi:hypothetical protein